MSTEETKAKTATTETEIDLTEMSGVVAGAPTITAAPYTGVSGDSIPMVGEAPLSRDEIRAKIFGAKPKSEIVENFYGATIELRQPDLKTALEARSQQENEHVFTMLLDYAYVPGTDQKVFEEADVEMIRSLPFGPEMTTLMAKVNKLLGIDGAAIEEMLKDATKSPEV